MHVNVNIVIPAIYEQVDVYLYNICVPLDLPQELNENKSFLFSFGILLILESKVIL